MPALFVQRALLRRLPPTFIGVWFPAHSPLAATSSRVVVDSELMNPNAPQPKRRNNVLSTLNVAIETSNLAKELSSITPAKAVFGTVSAILTMIKVGSFLGYPG